MEQVANGCQFQGDIESISNEVTDNLSCPQPKIKAVLAGIATEYPALDFFCLKVSERSTTARPWFWRQCIESLFPRSFYPFEDGLVAKPIATRYFLCRKYQS